MRTLQCFLQRRTPDPAYINAGRMKEQGGLRGPPAPISDEPVQSQVAPGTCAESAQVPVASYQKVYTMGRRFISCSLTGWDSQMGWAHLVRASWLSFHFSPRCRQS